MFDRNNPIFYNLNTSYVDIKLDNLKKNWRINKNLNTSYVDIKLKI